MATTPSQFGHPHGLLRHVVGWLMAGNAEMNERVVGALEIAPDDAVLEVGLWVGQGAGDGRGARHERLRGGD
ncbi:MAG TPA: hypothetical protein VFU88_20690 [Ktedonobacterales bacterium]|nr:hypothetical protein [Ktedonobacterales bacterium]